MWGCEDDVVDAVFSMMAGAWEAERIERRPDCNPGFPDVVYSYRGIRGLIEFKFVPNFQSKLAIRIGLTREQADFLTRHGRAGGSCHILLGVGRGDRLYHFHWRRAFDLLESKRPEQLRALGGLITGADNLKKLLGTHDWNTTLGGFI